MSEINENQDSNLEEGQQPNAENESNDNSNDDGGAEKLKEYGENQKIRAEKAERELKALKSKNSEIETPKKEQSSEPDYARLAFLEQRGVNNADDIKLVQDEASRLKLPLTDILSMEHIKTKLKDNNDQREAQSGMPDSKGRASGASKGDVDYYLANGKTPEDLKLAEKVINARMKKSSTGKMFSDELYTSG